MSQRKPISQFDLLLIANQVIQEHEDFIEGMRADSVEEKDGVLVFKGNYFLDENGLPTEKNNGCIQHVQILSPPPFKRIYCRITTQ
ncbi:hypothetical protein YciN [Vibrio variabilis]|uniref:Uncharacterized protein n=1 Tax=Vibrio variabilis TaxID=990271 RepID=A0ABQ0J978_9VIBR|nr:hypothetical protein YciN [Vibrio variabilis]